MKIFGIKTPSGYFLSECPHETSNYSGSRLCNYLINGENPTRTFNQKWVRINSLPFSIEKEVEQYGVNPRFELKNKELHNDKIPLLIRKGDIDYDNNGNWIGMYEDLQSLYTYVCDPNIVTRETIYFEFELLFTIDHELQDIEFNYGSIKKESITHPEICKILYPDILLPQQECYLSSEDSYNLIRSFVKENINPKSAEITSDYDFCFEVKKKIEISPYKAAFTNTFAKKPKTVYKMVDTRKVVIFEMTHDKKHYGNYTCIEGFKGNNIEDLKNNINTYLKELISYINEPVKECECCKGRGVIVNETRQV